MPTFVTEKDVAFFQRINVEAYELFFFPVKVFKLLIRNEFDKVYNENQNKYYDAPYEIEAYMPTLPEWQANQTRFGMDEARDLVIYFSIDLMKKRNVSPPEIGDIVEFHNDKYIILYSNPLDYNSNIQIPLSHVIRIKHIRPESPTFGTAIYKDY